ncbi:MAG: site-specific DNA-methyltransferase [Prevotella sp.]|nr:site-specific DNA-methyltransferase [Prevotella sp.]
MKKMNMQTTNIVDENIKRIGELFPNCITERLNDEGKPEVAIDFDQLRQELSKDIVEGAEERYQFTWPDKRNAIRLANAPTTDTLRPCREESVDFDNTQNLYIEGDNLQVLKLLRENYLGKVKMIYIDPPYNTGNDFVYNDNFDQDKQEYVHNSGQYDEEGHQLVTNTESNGRFHTDWLNMIYPRLKVAKDLLSEDGVIFISIGEHELRNLRIVCDDIFGEHNYISTISWVSKSGGSGDEKLMINATEYMILYAKNIDSVTLGREPIDTEDEKYNLEDKYVAIRGKYVLKKLDFRMTSLHYTESLNYPIKDPDGNDLWPGGESYRQDGGWNWRWSKQKVEWGFKNDFLEFRKNRGQWTLNTKQYQNVDNNNNPIDRRIAFKNFFVSSEFNTTQGSRMVVDYFGSKIFEYAKPVGLLRRLLEIGNVLENSIVLDFFSGSATTAHAVMQLNAENGGKRKFIMVQLPEATDEKSEAYKAGYKNICEIGKERIRRAGKKIKEESPLTTQDLDTGFRVLKLDSSNMQDVYYTPEEFDQRDLFEDNIKSDRTEEDLLFQVMIDLGIELSAKIEQTQIAGKTVWNVSDGYLMACFDEAVNETTITEIAKQQPYYFVMRDKSLANDNVADNFEQIFNHYSKDTIRRII